MEQCILWQGTITVSGYAQLKRAGKTYRVNRLVCEEAHGPAPTPQHQAAHLCGNRACVNPAHLEWKTPVENSKDKQRHGTVPHGQKSGTAKLSPDAVRIIRAARNTQTALAEQFGVSQFAIWAIKHRRTWAHIK